MAILKPVLSLFIDLNTVLTPRLNDSRFFTTVLTATCHTCELQFLDLGLFLVREYGHSSSNLSRICRCMSDSTKHSVSLLGLQHSPPPTKLNLRRIMFGWFSRRGRKKQNLYARSATTTLIERAITVRTQQKALDGGCSQLERTQRTKFLREPRRTHSTPKPRDNQGLVGRRVRSEDRNGVRACRWASSGALGRHNR